MAVEFFIFKEFRSEKQPILYSTLGSDLKGILYNLLYLFQEGKSTLDFLEWQPEKKLGFIR